MSFFSSVSFLLLLPLLSHSKSLPINIWPKPTKIHWPKPTFSPFSPHFTIHSPSPLLSSAISSSPLLSPPSIDSILIDYFSPLLSLNLFISDLNSPLQHAVDESYTLNISSSSGYANLTSPTVWGALHGLETFSQLTWSKNPPLVASDIFIFDRPIFPHRGLLLDTARNYYPVRDIKRTIDAMAMNKMNVFHWHVTDGEAFSIVLPKERGLAEKGAYGEGMRYEVEDVREVVEYGISRGVRVMPEIDVPGHTGSWAEAYPEITTCAKKFWLPNGHNNWSSRLASEPATGHLNPLLPKTYQVLANVITDVASLFPENFYHSGTDEITPACWTDDPAIQSFLSTGKTLSQVLEIFINKTHPLVVSLNKTAVYWEDVLLDPVINVHPSFLPTQSTILQTWKNGPRNTKRIVQAGYRVIVSSSDFYYLDCGHGGWVGNDSRYDTVTDGSDTDGSWCTPFKTWQRIYDYDIVDGLSEDEARLVIGGEVALWSEQADGTVLDGRLWPRAAAMAEALWSGNRDEKGRKRYGEATERLNEWRYKMVGRGIMAEPIQPLWCSKNPGMCNINS